MTTTLPFSSRFGGLSKGARTLALGLAATLGVAPLAAQAQLVLESAAPKTETFDGLGTSATATVPAGFKLSAEAAPTYASTNNYTATTVAAAGTNFTAGGTYNFGAATGSTDRALGFLNSGSYTTPRHILLAVRNTSGSTVQDLSVQFSLEKYRSGSREYNWTFWTSADGVTWTAQAAGAQNYPADANNTVYSYPPLTTTKTVTLTGLNLASGATTYLRWTQQGVGGSTNGQAAGLDDVTLTPTLGGATTPPPAAPTIATGSVAPTSFCVTGAAGSASFSVPFSTTGTLGGPYAVQLSDASGAFPAATTSGLIGSGSTSPLAATIPAGTASGSGYRVRVLGSSPATVGTDNGQDLTVSLTPANNPVTVTPSGAQSLTTTGTGATLVATATLAGSTYAWQVGPSATGPFTALGSAAGASYTLAGADFAGAGTYYVVTQATAATSCGNVVGTSDPVVVTVTAPTAKPVLTVSDAALADFGSVAAGAGALLKDFTVEGTGLTGPLTITPPAGFEIRQEGGAFACCPIVLTPSGGTIILTTIEVRFVPTAAQAYAASITVAGGGQPTQSVAVTGTGVAAVYPATLSTAALTNLAGASVTAGGTIADDGGSPVTARGVVWSRTASPTVLLTTKTTDGTGAGTFSSAVTGLVPGTTYYLRAYATNAAGTTYGEELTFTTIAVPLATEPTAPATITQGALGGTSVQLLLGGGPSQKRLVLARLGSTAPDALPTDATTYTASAAFGSGQAIATGTYVVYAGTGPDVTVTGLRPNTAYAFTVYAYNDNNTPYAENYLTTSPGTLGVTTPASPAALLLEENFDYTAGTLLTANNWTAHSGAGTNSIAVVAGSLVQAGYGPNSGNAAALTGNGEDVNRQFAPVYARTPTYAAFLVKVNSASTTADYFFHLGPQPIGTTFRARVFVRRTASGKVQFGTSSGTGTASYAPTEYELGSTNLLVVKYTFDEASNSSALFINPIAATEPATADATATETGTTPAAPNNNIGAVALRQGTNSPNLVVDGLRVGTSFRVVKTGLDAPASVSVLYRNPNAQPTGNVVQPYFQLVNTSAAAIPYQELTVRYYLTVEDFAAVQASVGYAELGTSRVQARYVALPQPVQGAFGYVEYSFTAAAGTLGAGANSGGIQARIAKQNYSAFNEADDYSYGASAALAATDRLTVYRNGQLLSGTEPTPVAAVQQLQALSNNFLTTNFTNTLSIFEQVRNTGNVPVPYQDLAVRYWFTPDSDGALESFVGYSELGTGNVSVTFGQAGTETYAELRFAASLGSLAPLSNSGLLLYHVHKSNWSFFNQANDYSFRPDLALAANPRLTVYQQGVLVYGQEPTGAQSKLASLAAALRTAPTASALGQEPVFEAFPNPFTDRTALHFRAATSGLAKLVVYNTLGQVVATLFDGPAQVGQDYGFTLEGTNLSAGAYLARLQVDGKTQTVRLLLAK